MAATVGFIGLGAMGKPMARNLLDAGLDLVVHSRSQGPVDDLAAAGARAADSPQAVAELASIIITMLPDTPDVEEVLTGDGGVLGRAAAGTLLIDMSTIAPPRAAWLAGEAQKHGCSMLDAPVSGGDVGANEGTLSIMVGGQAADFHRAEEIFGILGTTVVHLGPSGAGQTVKACNQVVVAGTIAALSEALVLAAAAGLRPEVVVRSLLGGFASSKVLEVRGQNFVTRDFTPGFRARLHLKDLGIALSAAHDFGVSVPSTAVVTQLFRALSAAGHGDDDHSALLLLIESLAERSNAQNRTGS